MYKCLAYICLSDYWLFTGPMVTGVSQLVSVNRNASLLDTNQRVGICTDLILEYRFENIVSIQ